MHLCPDAHYLPNKSVNTTYPSKSKQVPPSFLHEAKPGLFVVAACHTAGVAPVPPGLAAKQAATGHPFSRRVWLRSKRATEHHSPQPRRSRLGIPAIALERDEVTNARKHTTGRTTLGNEAEDALLVS